MVVYIFFYCIIFLNSLESFKLKKRILYFPTVILIIIFAAFRANGYDWISYEDIYLNLKTGGEQIGATFIEYGFELLCLISPTYKFLIFLIAVLSLSLTFKGIYYFSRFYLPILGLLIFASTLLLPTYMGQIRQGLAIGFVSIAIWQNYKSQQKKALLWLIIACFFHFSAILAFIILVVPKRKFTLQTYIGLIVISLLLYSISLTLMSKFLVFTQFGIVQKLIVYASSEKYELGISLTIIIRILTLLLSVFLNKDNNKSISYICNIYTCGILIYLIFGFLPQLGGRGALYFSVYEMVLVPYIVYQFRKKSFLYLTSYFIVVGLSAYRLVSFFSDNFNYYSYIPYFLY